MKGLIVKDFLILRGQARMFMGILLLYVVMGVFMKDFSFFSAIILLVSAMLVVTTCAYDDSYKWNIYAGTLPIKKNQIVLSKYISSLLFVLTGVAVSLLFNFISVAFGNLNFGDTLHTLYFTVVGSLLFVSIMLPIIFRFGTEKSRLLLPVLVALLIAGVFVLKELGVELPAGDRINQLADFAILPVAVLFFLSYLLSCKVFRRREN